MIETYTTNPVEVEAVQFVDESSVDVIIAWIESLGRVDWRVNNYDDRPMSIEVATLAGTAAVDRGWWLIRDPATGTFTSCRAAEFNSQFTKKIEPAPGVNTFDEPDGTDG
jgi:hypothetical protein